MSTSETAHDAFQQDAFQVDSFQMERERVLRMCECGRLEVGDKYSPRCFHTDRRWAVRIR